MAVRAPFRFSPIPDQVYFPDWDCLVTHDVPFKDGLSGEIALEIEAKTPLLVGGERKPRVATPEGPAVPREVWPFRLPDGTHAISSSSIQGLIRSVLEVATFGRLGPFIADRRMAMRDLKSDTGKEHYQSKMIAPLAVGYKPSVQAGWLIKTEQGQTILHCEMARIQFDELRARSARPLRPPKLQPHLAFDSLEARNSALDRYVWFLSNGTALTQTMHLDKAQLHWHANRTVQIEYCRAYAAPAPGRTPVNGTIVLTGKPQVGVGPGHKKQEFVFHSPARPAATTSTAPRYTIGKDVWRDFKLIHEAEPGRDENPNWTYWKPKFESGEPVPVFYLLDDAKKEVATFGTAFMFKMALKLSTQDMLRNSHANHMSNAEPARMDLPTLIFGAVADDLGNRGLKRRASFDLARAVAEPGRPQAKHVPHGPAVLLSPKPSYYPIYVRQPGNQVAGTLDDAQRPFAVASVSTRPEPERQEPKLAGVKLWPARGGIVASTLMCPPVLAGMPAVQTKLNALPAGTRFRTKLRFHNLRPMELGAVLWAMTYGRSEAWTPGANIAWRHRLGMAKPYGFGEIAIRVDADSLVTDPNTPQPTPWKVPALVGAFIAHMNHQCIGWATSLQIRALLAAADPAKGAALGAGALNYMTLSLHPTVNEFTDAIQARQFLPEYMVPPEAAFPVAGPPPPPPPPPLAVGMRVRVGQGDIFGVIVELMPNIKPPRCRVQPDKGGKPQPYRIEDLTPIA